MQIEFVKAGEVNEYLDKGARFIDLRETKEYEKRHIKGAVSIPFDDFENQYQSLPKSKIYVLYCERGASSMLAAKKMLKMGYQVKSLSGGYAAIAHMK